MSKDMSGQSSKQLIIHAATEIILVSILSVYFYKKQSALSNEVETLKATVQKQSDILDKCVAQINHLTDLLTYGSRPSSFFHRPAHPVNSRPSGAGATGATGVGNVSGTSSHPQTLTSMKHSMMGDLGNVFGMIQPMIGPIMAMASPNQASIIIGDLETIEKNSLPLPVPSVTSTQGDVPKVEIATDEEVQKPSSTSISQPMSPNAHALSEKDLNDVIEALNEESLGASSSISNVSRSRSPSLASIASISSLSSIASSTQIA